MEPFHGGTGTEKSFFCCGAGRFEVFWYVFADLKKKALPLVPLRTHTVQRCLFIGLKQPLDPGGFVAGSAKALVKIHTTESSQRDISEHALALGLTFNGEIFCVEGNWTEIVDWARYTLTMKSIGWHGCCWPTGTKEKYWSMHLYRQEQHDQRTLHACITQISHEYNMCQFFVSSSRRMQALEITAGN